MSSAQSQHRPGPPIRRLYVNEEWVSAGAHHAKLRGGFGWWSGTLMRRRRPVWDCGHQHHRRGEALACSRAVILAIRGESEPIYYRGNEWKD